MSTQALIDGFDWSATPIGERDQWPQSLRTSLSICLASRFPIVLWWGPELIKLYNDAYAEIIAGKHPTALGARGRDVWPEIWDVIGPMLDQVLREGTATWSDDQLLIMDRHGYAEETYFTFSYSPILDESGGIGGIFTAVFETTSRVIGERRLDTLRQLAARTGIAKSVEEACCAAADILAANPKDVPWAAIYLRRPGGRSECVARAGTPAIDIGDDLDWREEPAFESENTIVLPLNIAGEADRFGLLVAGVSPNRALDDDYRAFFTLVAGSLANAISDARTYEIERERAEALAELDRAKTEFFSNVSHEFRTPLTLMLGPLDEAIAASGDPATQESLQLARRNALRLLKLVNTLLDFSRIESGRIEAVYEPTDLSTLTMDLAATFRSAVERAGLRFIVDAPPLPEPVYVDREQWEKIVLNLVSNALKFTFEGEIAVTLRVIGSNVELAVRDTGTGIPDEHLPRVFERFHRVRGSRARTHEGSGIGLALVQELATLHGGAVGVSSTFGEGSTFTVSIPLGKNHLPSDRIGASRNLESTSVSSAAWLEEAMRWSPETRYVPQPGAARLGRILLADDNADMREYVQRLLSQSYEVEAVANGREAVEAARRTAPDLVLSDVMMPVMDGFQLLSELRTDQRTREIPVILLSARAGEESRVEGMQAGADDYLIKPFAARELLARVEAHIRLRRVRQEAQTALRESEEKFHTAFTRSPLPLTISALDDDRYIDVNEAFARTLGYRREDLLGRTPEELGLWTDPQVRRLAFARLRGGETSIADVEVKLRLKSGEERICLVGCALVEISGRRCVLTSLSDITERKRAEIAKDDFLATLSHELRTPLTSGYGWIKLLGRSRDPALLDTGLGAIEMSLINQMKLVDDLLDVSRIAAGKMHLEMAPLDLAAVLDSAVEMVRPSAASKQIDLRVHAPSLMLCVRGDDARLKQVFWNLLANAIKFSSHGGAVDVELRRDGDKATVRIRDYGEGIDAKFLPHVFDRFRQADASTTRRHGGLGIGLSIVSSLVETHSGSVRAESDGLGRGATFTVTLPLIDTVAIAVPGDVPVQDTSLAGARILVVEDDEASRSIITAALAAAGAEVRDCSTASDACAAVGSWRPDLLISDLAMPGEDGYSLIRRLRDDGYSAPAVAITAYVRAEDEVRVREAGFNRHVAKPFDPGELVRVVAELRTAM